MFNAKMNVNMAPDPRSPVIVGVGQHLQRAEGLDDALSPVDLIVEAVRAAAADTGAPNLISHAQSLRVVQLLSWRYRDPAALVAARLGIRPAETAYTTAGGNTPQTLVNLTASEILDGSLDCAVLMTPQEVVAENLLLLQVAFIRQALGITIA